MYRYLSIAVDELKQEPRDDATKSSLNFEKKSSDMRHKYLFDRLWFTDVCHKIKGIPAEKIQEFIQFKSKWNDQIKQILSTISQLVKKKELNSSEVSHGSKLKIGSRGCSSNNMFCSILVRKDSLTGHG